MSHKPANFSPERMPATRPTCIFVLVSCAVVLFLGLLLGCKRDATGVLTKEVLSAQHLEFVGEMPIPDGGSLVFHFLLPHRRGLAIQVLHRHDFLGGNPKFQEIRLDRSGAMKAYIDLRPGSELETKLLSLLETATCDNKGRPAYGWQLPTPERLKWLRERIRDRTSKW